MKNTCTWKKNKERKKTKKIKKLRNIKHLILQIHEKYPKICQITNTNLSSNHIKNSLIIHITIDQSRGTLSQCHNQQPITSRLFHDVTIRSPIRLMGASMVTGGPLPVIFPPINCLAPSLSIKDPHLTLPLGNESRLALLFLPFYLTSCFILSRVSFLVTFLLIFYIWFCFCRFCLRL